MQYQTSYHLHITLFSFSLRGFDDDYYILKKFNPIKFSTYDNCDDGWCCKCVMLDLFGNDIIEGCEIEWCQMKEQHSYWKLAGAVSSVLTYVNYSCLDSYYQAAAIYVGVPKWGKCRQKLAGRTEEGNAGNEGDKEEVMEEGNKKGELDDGNEDGHNDEADNDTVFMKIFGD